MDQLVVGPFDTLPTELLNIIFCFVPCFKTLGRLLRICRRFHGILLSDQGIWKTLCLQYWGTKKFNTKLSLEKVFRELQDQHPAIDWLWLTQCFSRENLDSGLTHRFFTTSGSRSLVSIGHIHHNKLSDVSLEIYLDGSTYYFGQFQDGKLHGKGSIYWEGGAKYQGDWVNGHREGCGIYQWANGDCYEGGFKYDGKKEGKGTFTYADGDRFQGHYKNDEREGWGRMEWKASQFFFEGMFAHNEPLDELAPLHPKIKRALDRQTCTGSVTGKSLDFGQFFYECESADYCSVCVHSCATETIKSIRRWSDGTYCHCIDKGCCARSDEPPQKKSRKTL